MQLTKSDLISLQNIIENAQELIAASKAQTLDADTLDSCLYCISGDSADLCNTYDVTIASDGF